MELAPCSEVAATSASAPIMVVYGDRALSPLSTPTKATHLECRLKKDQVQQMHADMQSWHADMGSWVVRQATQETVLMAKECMLRTQECCCCNIEHTDTCIDDAS